MTPAWFVSAWGRLSKGVSGGGARTAAAVLGGTAALLYGAGVALHAGLYRCFPTLRRRAPCPVICLGNLTVGGTGKTPAVEWLCRTLSSMGARPAIVSRGYGRRRAVQNEEALLLTEALPDVPHVQGSDRYKAALTVVQQHNPDCIVLDDGFQHWRLHRDLDIVLVDCTDPFGGGRLLPLGRLREPVSGLRRAGAVILTRSDAVDAKALDRIMNAVAFHASAPIACAVHRPIGIVAPTGEEAGPPLFLSGRRVFLVSGVGNPAAFRRTAESLGARVVGERVFADHYRYRSRDLDRVRREAGRMEAEAILTTEKDAVKIRFLTDAGGIPVWVVSVRFELVSGQVDAVMDRIRTAARGAAHAHGAQAAAGA